MISVVIIGYGNVGHHLTTAFLKAENVYLKQVYNRSVEKINHLANKLSVIDNLGKLTEADVYIIAISDDYITEVSSKITSKNAFVVHTSGSVSLNSLQNKGRKGVFYPLQSFSKDKKVDFNQIPFCLESENENDTAILERLASSIGKKTYRINSEQRQSLHVTAVFVNNFVNHLYKIGNDICEEYNVPFEILHPLIKETALKLDELSPRNAQTGPARRNDHETIKNHLNLLNKKQQEIYNLLTKSIQHEYQL